MRDERCFEQLLLIGGAPRSGTSLLVRLLDWHPRILSFSREPKYLADFFFDASLEPDPNGKEFTFASPSGITSLANIFRDFGDGAIADHYGTFDADAFREAYARGRSAQPDSPLGSHLRGLAAGFLALSARIRSRYSEPVTVFSVKNPFFAEACAPMLPGSKLLHIRRDGLDRYVSSKARALKANTFKPRGQIDYTSFVVLLGLASDALVEQARASLGDSHVVSLSYENLIRRPDELMKVCDLLQIEWDDVMRSSTLDGIEQILPSAHDFSPDAPQAAALRSAAADRLLSDPERAYVQSLSAGDHESARRVAEQPFCDETSENHAARLAFCEELDVWIADPLKLVDFVRAHRPALI